MAVRDPRHTYRPAEDRRRSEEYPYRESHEAGRPAPEPERAPERPVTSRCARTREQRLREARRVARVQLIAVVAVLSLALVAGWRAVNSEGASAPAAEPGTAPIIAQSETLADPTQVFAAYKTIQLYLPYPVESVKAIGFHQASGDNALHMTSVLPDADSEAAREAHHVEPLTIVEQPGSTPALAGTVLRMWRDRPGQPDSAVDVAAEPGTTVLSPVTGTVVQVKPYLLYGKHDDFEIHIRPDAMADVDVVIIHVEDVKIRAGDRVIGGVTPIAEVRLLSDRVTMQIGDFIGDGGDHVHIQINKVQPEGELASPGNS